MLPEEWDFILREVKDIWWAGWTELDGDIESTFPENPYQEFTQSMLLEDRPVNQSMRDHIKERLTTQDLPPLRWSASAGAQMLRYTAGAKARGSLDLASAGFLGIEGSMSGAFNLIEGKAELNNYLPHSEGYRMKLPLPAIDVRPVWEAQPDQSLVPSDVTPTFDEGSDFIQPEGLARLHALFNDWAASLTDISNVGDGPNVMLQVVASAEDPLAHQRSEAAYGYLSFQPGIWVQRFLTGRWGNSALLTMLRVYLHHRTRNAHLASQATFDAYIEQELINDPMRRWEVNQGWSAPMVLQDEQLGLMHRMYLRAYPLSTALTPSDERLVTETLLNDTVTIGAYTWSKHDLGRLALAYFLAVGPHPRTLKSQVVFWDQRPFTTTTCPGELCDLQQVAPNRVTLVPYRVIDTTQENVVKDFLFGDARMNLTGTLQGAAGVNAQLAGKLMIEVDKDKLLIGGLSAAAMGVEGIAVGGTADSVPFRSSDRVAQREEKKQMAETSAGAEAKGSLFAGLRGEAGVRIAMEWRPPKQNSSDPVPPWFGLADVGFAVTGLLGAGLAGSFSIGYDAESKRFQIKLKAELCLGPGAGGAVSFGVGVGVLFDFFKLVYRQLEEGGFNYLDIFEEETFDRLNALAYELLEEGHVLRAGLTYVAGGALEAAHTALVESDKLRREWVQGNQFRAQREDFVRTITDNADHIQYLTPEVKGRILYRLLTFKRDNQERFITPSEIVRFDKDYLVEEAALKLIRRGIHNAREWQETMEHMAHLDPNTQALSCIIPDNSSAPEKADRCRQNQRLVTEELIDGPSDLNILWQHLESIGVPRHD